MFLLYAVTEILKNKTMRIINCGVFLFVLLFQNLLPLILGINPIKYYQLKIQLSSLTHFQQP